MIQLPGSSNDQAALMARLTSMINTSPQKPGAYPPSPFQVTGAPPGTTSFPNPPQVTGVPPGTSPGNPAAFLALLDSMMNPNPQVQGTFPQGSFARCVTNPPQWLMSMMNTNPQQPGKSSWPELVGRKAQDAAAAIKRENPNLHVSMVMVGTPVSLDYRPNRVRVFVDFFGNVTSVPTIG